MPLITWRLSYDSCTNDCIHLYQTENSLLPTAGRNRWAVKSLPFPRIRSASSKKRLDTVGQWCNLFAQFQWHLHSCPQTIMASLAKVAIAWAKNQLAVSSRQETNDKIRIGRYKKTALPANPREGKRQHNHLRWKSSCRTKSRPLCGFIISGKIIILTKACPEPLTQLIRNM